MKKPAIIALTLGSGLFLSSVGIQVAHAVDSKQEPQYSACSDKEEGDACDYSGPKGESLNGRCRRAPSGDGTLICVQYTPG